MEKHITLRLSFEAWNFVSLFEKMAAAVSVLVFDFYFVANVFHFIVLSHQL